jgi:hypothetical protein
MEVLLMILRDGKFIIFLNQYNNSERNKGKNQQNRTFRFFMLFKKKQEQ